MNFTFLSDIIKKVKVKDAQLYPSLCDPVDYTVHGIFQARILEWVAFPFSRGSSQHRDQTQVSHIVGKFLTSQATREAQESWSGQPIPSPANLPNPGIKPAGSPALQADSLVTELRGKPDIIYTINLTNCVLELYTETQQLNNWRDVSCSQIGGFNTIKMLISPTQRDSMQSISHSQNPTRVFREI